MIPQIGQIFCFTGSFGHELEFLDAFEKSGKIYLAFRSGWGNNVVMSHEQFIKLIGEEK